MRLRSAGHRPHLPSRSASALVLLAGSALSLGSGGTPAAAHTGQGHAMHGHHAGESVATRARVQTTVSAAGPSHHAMGSRATMASPAGAHTSMPSMWTVGTATDPLVMRARRGPILSASTVKPGTTSHGTLGKAVVDGLIAERREAAEADALATRAKLMAAQATKKLSKRCRALVAKKASKLSKPDRKRRAACLSKRKRLIDASAKQKPAEATPTPGVSAPAAPGQGPDPTTAPPASTPTPTPAAGEPTPSPTPVPAGPVYGAVGVTATEGAEPFKLTRSFTTADIVSFELVNTDSQPHDLYIAAADENGQISGPPEKVIGRTNGQVNGKPTRATYDMKLAPGRYRLICTVPGHGKMEVGFTVYAPVR